LENASTAPGRYLLDPTEGFTRVGAARHGPTYQPGGGKGDDDKIMGVDHVITDRETLRKHPPDILLTNYKMLDFLMLRPEDGKL
jgi:hypothetical protein